MDAPNDERFDWIIGQRPGKPREVGLTMVVGDGPFNSGGLRGVRDLIEVAGDWVDWYKFIWAAFPLQPPSLMQRKIELLVKNDIVGFAGGNFLEAAFLDGEAERLLDTLSEAGCPGVEVSSTAIEMELDEKLRLIEAAAERGLHVHAEIGKKASETRGASLPTELVIEEMQACLAAGADVVIFEMEEFADQEDRGTVLSSIVDAVDYREIMFELPLSGYHEVMATSWWFIDRLGPDVNLGNVNPNHVLLLEQQRRGIGPYSFTR